METLVFEYPYTYLHNTLWVHNLAGAFSWIVPLYFLLRFIQFRCRNLTHLGIFILGACTLLLIERHVLNERFLQLASERDRIVLVKPNGANLAIPSHRLARFWSISFGRTGYGCYLLVELQDQTRIRGMGGANRLLSCARDASELNRRYRLN